MARRPGGRAFQPAGSPPPASDCLAAYKLRLYPDLTHNKLSQFEVPAWDQAYALTLGREAINPRPRSSRPSTTASPP